MHLLVNRMNNHSLCRFGFKGEGPKWLVLGSQVTLLAPPRTATPAAEATGRLYGWAADQDGQPAAEATG